LAKIAENCDHNIDRWSAVSEAAALSTVPRNQGYKLMLLKMASEFFTYSGNEN
jgi:hypothetical protein